MRRLDKAPGRGDRDSDLCLDAEHIRSLDLLVVLRCHMAAEVDSLAAAENEAAPLADSSRPRPAWALSMKCTGCMDRP